ncbi:hypothetical protein EON63_17000, partial [archaeon]
YNIPYTIHHTPYTIHHTPYTIHHTPYTIHHTPYTIHYTPWFSLVVLTEVDRLSKQAQAGLRRTMERYSAQCRLVLVCSSLTKVIEPIRSRCMGIRVSAPSVADLSTLLMQVRWKCGNVTYTYAYTCTYIDAYSYTYTYTGGKEGRRFLVPRLRTTPSGGQRPQHTQGNPHARDCTGRRGGGGSVNW